MLGIWHAVECGYDNCMSANATAQNRTAICFCGGEKVWNCYFLFFYYFLSNSQFQVYTDVSYKLNDFYELYGFNTQKYCRKRDRIRSLKRIVDKSLKDKKLEYKISVFVLGKELYVIPTYLQMIRCNGKKLYYRLNFEYLYIFDTIVNILI